MDGAESMRANNKNRNALSAMKVVVLQLDSISDFASSKPNISNDLKQALLRLRKAVTTTKHDHEH